MKQTHKTVQVAFRVTPIEKKGILRAAKSARLEMSDFLRRAVREKLQRTSDAKPNDEGRAA